MCVLKLSVVAAVTTLLLLGSMPSQAEVLFFDFTSVLHNGIGSGNLSRDERLLTGTFYADVTYPSKIYGFHNALYGGRPINVLTSQGMHDLWSNPSRPIASMYVQFIPQKQNGVASQVVLAFQKYEANGTPIVIAYDTDLGGGPSVANFTPRLLPEIDCSVLPRAVFIIFGTFLMLFGPKKYSGASFINKTIGNRRHNAGVKMTLPGGICSDLVMLTNLS